MAGSEAAGTIEQRAQQRVVEIGALLADHLTKITEVLQDDLVDRIKDLKGDPIIIELLQASIQGNLEYVAHCVQGHIPLECLEVPTTANEYARRLAQRGIGLDALLRAYRLGQRGFLDWAFDQLTIVESDAAVRFSAARQVTATTFEYVDRISEGVVESYQVEREQWLASRNTVRAEILESLLAGHPIDVAAAESGLGHRLRQHHLGLVLWRPQAGSAAQDLRDLEKAASIAAHAVGSGAAPLFVSRDRATGWAWLSLGRRPPPIDVEAITSAVDDQLPAVRVAIGAPGAAEEGFRTTHFEAIKAQRVAMVGQERALPVTWYGDGGVRAAALLTADLDNTRRLVSGALGNLAVDSQNAARLRETLLTADRSVPGHWEGDLIIGKANASAIGTLVERTTGYTLLVPLTEGFKAERVAPALATKIKTLPDQLRRTLTWDQGVEMRDWKRVQVATDIAIYFCDPHSPWQRATNENTNELLRQYFPKGTDLSVHTEAHLDAVAAELNDRPRKRLQFKKPIELIGPLLLR